MGQIHVVAATLANGRIERLRVEIPRLPPRVIDRDTAIRWMKDGHSFLPVVAGATKPALVLVEGPDDGLFVRDDAARVAADALPDLPPA